MYSGDPDYEVEVKENISSLLPNIMEDVEQLQNEKDKDVSVWPNLELLVVEEAWGIACCF